MSKYLKFLDDNRSIMEAFSGGAVIEQKSGEITNAKWFVTNNPGWFVSYEYRIKPESKVIFVNHATCGAIGVYNTKGAAEYGADITKAVEYDYVAKKFVEAIDE